MNKAVLKAIPGGKSNVGTKAWADKMRKRAVDVSAGLETGYMELAEVLYNLFDVPVDGDPNNGPWFKEWGYSTIGDFAETELNLNRRKAEYLRAIWYRLEVELEDMDPKIKSRIVSLGWSKVRELIKVLTLKNASKWADVAEKCNYQDLQTSVHKFQDKAKTAKVAKETGEKYVTPSPAKISKGDLPTAFEMQPPQNDEEPVEDDDLDNVPEVSESTYKGFKFYKDQWEIVSAALARAKELSNSQVDSHNLSVICQDFLATNLFGKPGPDQMIRFLAKYEKLFNVRLVVIDQDDDPVYGVTHLEALQDKLGAGK
jgi:hypothetical protein